MIIPTREKLLAYCSPGSFLFQGVHCHPDPRVYKYVCQVFFAKSVWEGIDFFSAAPRLCLHDAMKIVEQLVKAGEPCILYQTRVPREGAPVPFNLASLRWQEVQFACRFEDDGDPDWQGYK